SAQSFARFEVKRGMHLSLILIYWASMVNVVLSDDRVQLIPERPPRVAPRLAVSPANQGKTYRVADAEAEVDDRLAMEEAVAEDAEQGGRAAEAEERRLAAEAEERWLAAEAEERRLAAEAEERRLAAQAEQRARLDAEAEARRLAAEGRERARIDAEAEERAR